MAYKHSWTHRELIVSGAGFAPEVISREMLGVDFARVSFAEADSERAHFVFDPQLDVDVRATHVSVLTFAPRPSTKHVVGLLRTILDAFPKATIESIERRVALVIRGPTDVSLNRSFFEHAAPTERLLRVWPERQLHPTGLSLHETVTEAPDRIVEIVAVSSLEDGSEGTLVQVRDNSEVESRNEGLALLTQRAVSSLTRECARIADEVSKWHQLQA